MKIAGSRGAFISVSALLSLVVGVVTMTAQAASPAPAAQYQAFKIGSYSALALKDGAIQEPNDGKSFVVGREVDGGVEYKKVPSPAVITVDLRIVASHAVRNGVTPATFAYSGEGARLPSLKGIMAAKKKPMAVAKLGDYGAEAKPMIREVGVTLPPPRAAGQIVADIPTLVKKLAEEAKVI